ncbi:MAG: DUF2085 domain-containing protein [Chloroflexota bacterium]|nr:DUF2085 domain-containing protein [Chloroflexota bacterium]
MPTILLYTKPNCALCDTTRDHLRALLAARPAWAAWPLEERNILDEPAWFAAYHETIPVVVVAAGPPLTAPASLDRAQLFHALASADAASVATGPAGSAATFDPGAASVATFPPVIQNSELRTPNYAYPPPTGVFGVIDRAGNGLGGHWAAAVNTLLGVFVILPWLAPIFARLGWWTLANPIYTAYMLFCHQLPERAAFLFGYQVAYCWRNSAIYTTIFVGGLLYARARQGGYTGRLGWLLRPIAWPLFVLALVPLGVDGFSHLLGLRETNAWFDTLTGGLFGTFSVGDAVGTLNWWLRIFTGTLFGYAVVRLLYPLVGLTLDQSRAWLAAPPRVMRNA